MFGSLHPHGGPRRSSWLWPDPALSCGPLGSEPVNRRSLSLSLSLSLSFSLSYLQWNKPIFSLRFKKSRLSSSLFTHSLNQSVLGNCETAAPSWEFRTTHFPSWGRKVRFCYTKVCFCLCFVVLLCPEMADTVCLAERKQHAVQRNHFHGSSGDCRDVNIQTEQKVSADINLVSLMHVSKLSSFKPSDSPSIYFFPLLSESLPVGSIKD